MLSQEQEGEMRAAFSKASLGESRAVPLDWQDTTCPRRWDLSGREETFDWMPDAGTVFLEL